ncbi:4724_t:CDS:2, partial [Gigaspora margarita]
MNHICAHNPVIALSKLPITYILYFKDKAEDLNCLFNNLVDSYKYTKQLAECETKEKQRFCNASTDLIKNRIQLFEPYFSELSGLKNELQKYVICEKHYNQIIAKDNYLDYLRESSTIDIRIQVTMDSDLLTQINTLNISLANLTKNNRISELEHECEYFKKQIAELNTNQLEIEPRKCHLLSEDDINQLFYLNNDMKKILEEELQYFINEIINNLLVEKCQEPNEIDMLIKKQNNVTNKMKKCSQCLTSDINNKK